MSSLTCDLFKELHELYKDEELNESSVFKKLNGKILNFDRDALKMSFEYSFSQDHANHLNNIHGGYLVTAIDTSMGILAHFKSKTCVTAQLNTSFIKPVDERDIVVDVEITTNHHRQTILHAIVSNKENEIKATANGTFIAIKS